MNGLAEILAIVACPKTESNHVELQKRAFRWITSIPHLCKKIKLTRSKDLSVLNLGVKMIHMKPKMIRT